MQKETKTGQSIYDLAIMYGYGIEGLIAFAESVGIDSVEQPLENKTLEVTKIDTNLSNYLDLQGVVLSTGAPGTTVVSGSLFTDGGIQLTDGAGVSLEVD